MKNFAIFTVAVLIGVFATQTALAQGFDVEAYLKKVDTNSNGQLDPNEMSGRTRGWVGKLGFNVDKPVSIRKLMAKINKDREDRERENARKNAPKLKVPGFGIDAKKAEGVAGFGSSATGESGNRTTSRSKTEYSDRIKEQVKGVLDRYDSNKNGILDPDEIKKARWGSPKPEDSDTNRDGRLSKTELAQRYLNREKYYQSRSSDRRSRSSRDSGNDPISKAKKRESFRLSGSGSSPSRSSSSSSRSSSSSSSKSSSVDRAKYERYADSLIKQYDKNKSGALEKDEVAQMRRPPKADANKDGTISKDELIDSLTGRVASASPSKPASGSKSSTDRSRGSRLSSSSSSSRTSSGSSSFDKLDANQDRRVHMHEFGKDWNQKLVEEFNAKDKNGDGVITLSEWQKGAQ